VALAGLAFFTLLHTLSRGSYVAFIFTCLGLVALTRKKRFLLVGVLVFGTFLFSFMKPAVVTNRINETFTSGTVYRPFGTRIVLDESSSARVDVWKNIFDKAKKRPFFGYGVSAFGLIDSQYPLVLAETGLIGLWIFIWLMVRIFRDSLQVYRAVEDDWGQGLTLGFLAGFIGLLAHGFSAATFIIVRIMEPFWFIAAMVMMLLQFENIPEQPERTTLKHV
jgi:O-antigen ligase